MVHTVDEYLSSLEGPARAWVAEYVSYIRQNYPEATEGLSYHIPTYKTASACLAFCADEGHFILHTPDRALLARLRPLLPAARFSRGAVKIPYSCPNAKTTVYEACRALLGAPDAQRRPPVLQ